MVCKPCAFSIVSSAALMNKRTLPLADRRSVRGVACPRHFPPRGGAVTEEEDRRQRTPAKDRRAPRPFMMGETGHPKSSTPAPGHFVVHRRQGPRAGPGYSYRKWGEAHGVREMRLGLHPCPVCRFARLCVLAR